jgi:arginyl-tRNA--protein-N-Asp/Glu arginylyltransferase
LCRNPLFDPEDKFESKKAVKSRGNLDDDRELKNEGVWPQYLGGYHMLHIIDGEIFAVGVIDLTPNVLSSVYLAYDPKYEFLSPGIFSAVREIEYI